MALQDYYTILTSAGLAYEANRKALGLPIKLTEMSVGDGNGAVYNPSAAQTAMVREVWRGPINALLQDATNPTYLVGELTLPDNVGGWYVREVGFWTDSGILYAIGKYPESFKPELSAGAGKEFYIRAIFETSNAASVTLVVDDTVVKATRAFVVDYVAAELSKRDGKNSVRVATTGAIVLSGAQSIDGVAVVAGDRVLVKDQAAAADNGIYVVATGAWSRAEDADASIEVTPGLHIPVEQGTANGDSVWHLVTDGAINIGTTGLVFEMLAGRTGISAGTYRSVTVDKYGRVTGGTNPTTLAGYGITDARRTKVVVAGDLNTYTIDVLGSGSALTNAPLGDQGFWYLEVQSHGSGGAYCRQTVWRVTGGSPECYFRHLNNGTWTNWEQVFSPASAPLPPGYFAGFTLANSVAAPNTTIEVGAGAARDSADAVNIRTGGVLRGILQVAGAWTAGDNQNKLDVGARASNAWYHVFTIRKTSDGTADILFSLSASAPTLPAGYAGFRRISSVRTDGSGNIVGFTNVGRAFLWKALPLDVNVSGSVVDAAYVLSVPPGVRVLARLGVGLIAGEAFWSYRATDSSAITPSYLTYVGGSGMASNSVDYTASEATVLTNTAAQAHFRTEFAASPFRVVTYGWTEF